MTNPFDVADASFVVLENDQGQHSLWPAAIEAPSGWTIAHRRDSRRACLEFVDAHWTDMRPRLRAERLDQGTASAPAGERRMGSLPEAPAPADETLAPTKEKR